MKIEEFEIGTEFWTNTGQAWRCTDVGCRTILAIELKPDMDAAWFIGPPYVVPEVPFDAIELRRAYRTTDDILESTLEAVRERFHPGYPSMAMAMMMKAWTSDASQRYPRPNLFRVDRVNASGEILHPYAVEQKQKGGRWIVLVYLPFTEAYDAMPEGTFVNLRMATEEDYKRRLR